MRVGADNFDQFFEKITGELRSTRELILDTETTGLRWYKNSMPFSIILKARSSENIFYLDLLGTYRDVSHEPLVREHVQLLQDAIFCRSDLRLVMHNAKFDWHMLANLGIRIDCEVYDTMAMHSLVNNLADSYSLGKLTGQKSDGVKDWIRKNPKLGKVRLPPTEKFPKGELIPAFWKVPLEILLPYAEQDVRATEDLYVWQQSMMKKFYGEDFCPAYHIELRATRTIWNAERRGILVDEAYTLAGRELELKKSLAATEEFEVLTGEKFVNSGKALGKIFTGLGIQLPRTEKGNVQCTAETLESIDHPVAQIIVDIRKPLKKISTYYDNFMKLRCKDGAIHTDFRQCGADTLRMSSSAPNCQNISAEDEVEPPPEYILRGCFKPREGYVLVSIDFQAQEMRCIIDSAGEAELAQKIIGGEDVHQATADMMGVKRKPAKSIGFGIIYGMGNGKLAGSLRVPETEARRLKDLYFTKLPKVKRISHALMKFAEENGYIITRYGNRVYIEKGYEYKATNYYVQGSCAIHTKNAANLVDDCLRDMLSNILLLVHDELVLEIHKSEMYIIKTVKELMEKAYPHDILPMGTSEEVYSERWGQV